MEEFEAQAARGRRWRWFLLDVVFFKGRRYSRLIFGFENSVLKAEGGGFFWV